MRKFDSLALVTAFGLVAGLFTVAAVNPLDPLTQGPKADLANDILAIDVASGGPLPSTIVGVNPANGPVATNFFAKPLHSSSALSLTFERLGYDLDAVANDGQVVPRLFLANLPSDLDAVREPKNRKAIFFKTMLPLVLQANSEILQDRKRLQKLIKQQNQGLAVAAVDRLWLIVMYERYRVKRGDQNSLLSRIDIIPPSIALAQGAEESGWGTSRFVKLGNALYGQWAWGAEAKGIVPANRDSGKTHKIRAFDTLLDSVRAYMRNLNTHRAYTQFRNVRLGLRQTASSLNGLQLIDYLTSYSERGEKYVSALRSIIMVNKLRRLDGARLSELNGNNNPNI